MGSHIMGSVGYWDHNGPDWWVPNYPLVPNSTLKAYHLLLLSVGYWNQFVSLPKWSPWAVSTVFLKANHVAAYLASVPWDVIKIQTRVEEKSKNIIWPDEEFMTENETSTFHGMCFNEIS